LEKETFFLTKKHAEFFKQWERLITNEEEFLQQYKKEIWCLRSDERQVIGRFFIYLFIYLFIFKIYI